MSLDFGKPDKESEQKDVERLKKSLFWRTVWLWLTYWCLKSSRVELANRNKARSDESVKKAQEALQKYIASRRQLRRDRKENTVIINLDKKE